MGKIFDVSDWLNNHPNRNNFDLTHKVHASYKMGVLYPFLCKPVVPTDSFRIDTAISARFMPMPFPTQSNVRFVFHYFYVRAKNLWKNFPNWIQGLEQHTPPYLNKPKEFYRNGSLADYLDIPTSVHIPARISTNSSDFTAGLDGYSMLQDGYHSRYGYFNYNDDSFKPKTKPFTFSYVVFDASDINNRKVLLNGPHEYFFNIARMENSSFVLCQNELGDTFVKGDFFGSIEVYDHVFDNFMLSLAGLYLYIVSKDDYHECYGRVPLSINNQGSITISQDVSLNLPNDKTFVYFLGIPNVKPHYDEMDANRIVIPFTFTLNYRGRFSAKSFSVADNDSYNPYFGPNNSTGVKVSALPFRAVESVYNAFYRNQQGVQPFTVAGQVKYNQYVTRDTDGADATNYILERHNWELDAYTSCLISPQQNSTPYVGMTRVSALGEMEIETSDGNRASVKLDDLDNGVEITDLHGETPEARRLALNAASLGFTIPEFREANALQRFLELNIRKGYRYIDFIAGHFGKSPKYAEMDMPEFIGGFTQRVKMNEISNTNAVGADGVDALGSLAGQARAIGGSQHGISHYFDDFGFIVGMVCIIPDIAYDSILPKHYNLTHPLDMYFPEFGQLSMQPITFEEFCPIQSKVNNLPLTDVFGYQRPNHDLVWYPDTVHGEFRNPTNGFGDSIIVRRFGERPSLNSEFLKIKPEDTDTIFSYQMGDSDICLSEIVCKISAKRPIPRIVVPNL